MQHSTSNLCLMRVQCTVCITSWYLYKCCATKLDLTMAIMAAVCLASEGPHLFTQAHVLVKQKHENV